MNICVLGWYGSETLGDRAILDGVVRIFSELSKDLEFNIGSLYPVLTKRTLFEDRDMYERHAEKILLNSFDVKDKKQIKKNVDSADFVIMGGGPMMDLQEMFIIKYALRYAKKQNKKTALVGCGYGPFNQKAYKKCFVDIIGFSDAVIMRSENCKKQTEQLISQKYPEKEIYCSLDPAIISVLDYKEKCSGSNTSNDEWVINVRDLDYVYDNDVVYYPEIKQAVETFAKNVSKLTLVPMHTFMIGGDDRYIQNNIARDLKNENVMVVQKPLSLKEMYDKVSNAAGCVGMRYHSIVFQTFLNGNNYILDYTDSKTGKIKAFLDLIDKGGFYQSRYINIFDKEKIRFTLESERFIFDDKYYLKSCNEYAQILSDVR